MFFSKRNRIIQKAVKKTVSEFANRTPKIYEHFFYGAIDINPRFLVVWYLFETDAELESAKQSGLCDELSRATMNNLFALGYPREAFDMAYFDAPMITVVGGSKGDQESSMLSSTYRKGFVSFTTKEDINTKAHGDYYLYFK